jgi:putative ABC transport system permease protein
MSRKQTAPPRAAQRILSILSRYEDEFSMSGDLDEEYGRIRQAQGGVRANMWYWGQAAYSFPAYLKWSIFSGGSMLKHFLIVALRNTWRNKHYSTINMLGLAIGMASSLMLIFWALDELSYDRFHENSAQIYRIIQERKTDRVFKTPSTPSPLALELVANYQEIEKAVRIRSAGISFRFGTNQDQIFDQEGLYTDPEIFQVFTFPLKSGSPESALADPRSIVISETMARACFGSQDPLGKTLTAANGDPFQIRGILARVPENSHLQFDYLVPLEYLVQKGRPQDRWNLSDSRTYILLGRGVDFQDLNHRLAGYVKDRVPQISSRLIFQPLSDIHLRSLEGGGPIVYVSIALILALFILIVASINFMNLATARFGTRSLEVGVKKVVGARRPNLVTQFLGESMILAIVSVLLALGLVLVFLPVFNHFLGKGIGFEILGTAPVLAAIAAVTLFTGIVSGIYPALYLSAFSPVQIFKGLARSTRRMLNIRRSLVVFQFVISLTLIFCTLVVSRQLNFIRSKDLGFDKDNLIFFQCGDNPQVEFETMKRSLTRSPFISDVTTTNAPLLWLGIETTGATWEGKTPDRFMNVQIRSVDFDYLRTFRMSLAEGRFFSREMRTDARTGFVLNEAAAKVMGLESPLGKWFSLDDQKGEIIGVVRDFHHHSVHEAIEPVVFLMEPSWNSYVFVRTEPGRTAEAIKVLADNWRRINPDRSFSLSFMDEEIDALYRSEKELGRFIQILSGLAVFISCLGLFGLVSYATEQRTKEIGIRKVLGASLLRIQVLLSMDFLKWVLIATALSWPVAYYVTHDWLQNFAYRTSIEVWDFMLAGALVLAVALLTVSFQSLRAAAADPVKSLRYE